MKKIYDLLPEGREAAIPAKDLARIAGLSSTRLLQRQIEQERAGGAVILSRSDGGYYRSSDPEELRRFIRTLDAATGQQRIEGWFDG